MRLLVTLVTALALLLTACGGADQSDTAAPADSGDPTPTETATTDPDPDVPTEDPTEEATDEPAGDDASEDASDDTDEVAGDCSAAGLDDTVQGDAVSEQAMVTAAFLLDAAVRCDEQLLHTAAEESATSFFFGSSTFDEVFALPEDPETDPAPWEALARLLGSTTPVQGDADIWTWPAAAAPSADDAAWQELVDSGLYTQAQVDELREAGEGYLGWRVGIESDGTWLFFTAGD